MKGEQISMIDIVDPKDKFKFTPEVWSCMKTCANFTNITPDGIEDFFPMGGKRCVTPSLLPGKEDWHSEVIDNVWHTWCRCYKPKGGKT